MNRREKLLAEAGATAPPTRVTEISSTRIWTTIDDKKMYFVSSEPGSGLTAGGCYLAAVLPADADAILSQSS